jgi:hypothetical protein
MDSLLIRPIRQEDNPAIAPAGVALWLFPLAVKRSLDYGC